MTFKNLYDGINHLKNIVLCEPDNFNRINDEVIYEKYGTNIKLENVNSGEPLLSLNFTDTGKIGLTSICRYKTEDNIISVYNQFGIISATIFINGDIDTIEDSVNTLFSLLPVNTNIKTLVIYSDTIRISEKKLMVEYLSDGVYNENIKSLEVIAKHFLKEIQEKQISLTLIRHGKTKANVDRILQGVTDSPLVEKDYKNVDLIKPVLEATKVYSSPIRRAIDTAWKYTDEILILNELSEFNWGFADGKLPLSEEFIEYGNNMHTRNTERYYTGAETTCELYQRIVIVLMRILQENIIGDKIVCFTHSLPIIVVRSLLANEPFNHNKFYIPNETSITI